MKRNSLNFIDLFAGAGGLSEGFMQTGFNPIAHVEMNSYAAETLKTRACYYYLKKRRRLNIYFDYLRGNITKDQLYGQVPNDVLKTVINKEMSDRTIYDIFEEVDAIMHEDGIDNVDVIIGGPPCQAYSLVGRAQDAEKMAADPRNELYKLYARFLNRYNPKMFVFENVPGILTARGGEAWRNLNKYLKRVGYEIDYRELDASKFGVLQKRKRIIIIGWRKESGLSYPEFKDIKVKAIVNDLLSDLPLLERGHELNEYKTNKINDYLRKFKIRTDQDVLTHHVCRNHREEDVQIYSRAIELWNSEHRRLKYTDLPEELCTHKNRTAFLDRFKVLAGDLPFAHTMLAHISKDGHYFIHPDIEQCRSISVREAARVQSFPDNFYFEGPRTAQFVQIGNAVPPLMAKGIAKQIKKLLQN
jgi:DNA (cytosine-5)-methyltransferase 1